MVIGQQSTLLQEGIGETNLSNLEEEPIVEIKNGMKTVEEEESKI